MSNFVFYILLFYLSEIGIVYLLSLLLVSDYTSFYGGGGGERALLQHSSCIGHLWYFMRFLFTLLLHGTLAPTLFLLQFWFTDQRAVW